MSAHVDATAGMGHSRILADAAVSADWQFQLLAENGLNTRFIASPAVVSNTMTPLGLKK